MAGEEARKKRRGGKREGNQGLLIAHTRGIFQQHNINHTTDGAAKAGKGGEGSEYRVDSLFSPLQDSRHAHRTR